MKKLLIIFILAVVVVIFVVPALTQEDMAGFRPPYLDERFLFSSDDSVYILLPAYWESHYPAGFKVLRAGPYDAEAKPAASDFKPLTPKPVKPITEPARIKELLGTGASPAIAGMTLAQIKDAWRTFRTARLSAAVVADNFTSIAQIMGMMYVDRDVQPGKIYYYKLEPGIEKNKKPVGIKVQAEKLPVPEQLSAYPGENKIRLEWYQPRNETRVISYNIYRSDSKEGTFNRINTVAYTARSFINMKLTNEKTYYYRVSALDFMGGESEMTALAEAIPSVNAIKESQPKVLFPATGTIYVMLNSLLPIQNLEGFIISRAGPTDSEFSPDYAEFKILTKEPLRQVTEPAKIREIFGPGAATETLELKFEQIKEYWNKFQLKAPVQAVSSNYTAFASIMGVLFVDREVEPEKSYIYKIESAADKEIMLIDMFNVTVKPEPVTVPVELTGEALENKISLRWNATDTNRIIGYNVYRSLSKDGVFEKQNTEPVPVPRYYQGGLENGVPYYYRVSALDFLGGESDTTEPIELIPVDMTPPSPVLGVTTVLENDACNLRHEDVPTLPDNRNVDTSQCRNNHAVTVKWKMSIEPDVVGYTILRKLYAPKMAEYVEIKDEQGNPVTIRKNRDGSPDVEIPPDPITKEPIPSDVTTYVDKTVENGGRYLYYVTAADKAGNISQLSAESLLRVPDTIPPVIPAGLKGEPTKNKSILMSWEPNPDKDLFGYMLYRGKTAEEMIVICNDIIPAGTNSFEDIRIDSGITYFYGLVAIDMASNESQRTPALAVTAPNFEPPAAPFGVFAMGDDSVVTLTWTPNQEPDIDAYRIYFSNSATGTFQALEQNIASGTLQFIHQPVENGQTIWYQIIAIDNAGNESKPSEPVSAFPFEREEPAQPVNIIGTFGAPGTPEEKILTLKWTANSEKDIAGYAVYRAAMSRTGEVERISGPTPIPKLSFEDSSLKPGVEYWYVLRAWDTSGNRSDESETAGPFMVTPEPEPAAGGEVTPEQR